MSVATKNLSPERVFNVPNQITASAAGLVDRAVRAVAAGLPLGLLVVFVVAASTDWVDGYWARKYGQVTTLGRILDPFVDKIIICGTFIYLAAVATSGVAAWMAVVVVGRELLVTALRTFLEGEGADFSASMSGKLKMVFQCVAVGVSLFGLTYGELPRPEWLAWLLPVSVWSAVALTIYSGLEYIRRAVLLLRR